MEGASPSAHAGSKGIHYLETIGITTAVGAILGASTLPFYDQPQEHADNIAYGASAGAAVGVGIALYGLIAGPSQDEFQDARNKPGYQPGFLPADDTSLSFLEGHTVKVSSRVSRDVTSPFLAGIAPQSAIRSQHALWLPLVSVHL